MLYRMGLLVLVLRMGGEPILPSVPTWRSRSVKMALPIDNIFHIKMSTYIPSFVRVSPFGPYCHHCNVPLSIERGVYKHGKDTHPNVSFINAFAVRGIKSTMSNLRNKYSNDLSTFLKVEQNSKQLWFCFVCFTSFHNKSNYSRHLRGRNTNCATIQGCKTACFPTVCGRMGPQLAITASQPTIVSVGTTINSLTGINVL